MKFKKNHSHLLPIISAGILILPINLQAAMVAGQSIGLDFGNNAGAGVTPTGWNAISNGNSIADLIDIDSTATGVSLDIISVDSTSINFFNDDSHIANSPDGLMTTDPVPSPFTLGVAEDWSGVVNGDGYEITLGGLTGVGLTYDVLVYVGAWTNNEFPDQSTVSANSGQTGSYGDIGLDGALVSLTGVTPDVSGNVIITISGANPTGTPSVDVISGLYITAVPEPSSALLLGLGGAAFFLRRRR